MKPHLISFFLLSLIAGPLSAQQPVLISDEIIVTASALPEKLDAAPAAATVVTREEIDAHAARDVADVLREVPGLALSRTGSQGRATSLFTRGSNSTHTLVLWNGVELTNPYFAGYDWGRFSTLGVEQVEVVRGPFSALYGSDAVAGVVNVLTNPTRSELRLAGESGGNGLRSTSGLASIVRGRSFLSLSLESRRDDGFTVNDDFEQDSANLMLRWGVSETLSAGLSVRQTEYDLGVPMNLNAAADALVPSPNRRQDGSERQIAIPIEQAIGRFHWELTLAESRRDDNFDDPDDPYGYVSVSTDSVTRRGRLTARVQTGFGTIVAGGEIEEAEVDDVTNFGPNLEGNSRTERSLFVEDRLTHQFGRDSRIEISAGFRYDDYETFGSQLSPRLSAAWAFGANRIRAGYGEAFRAPSIGELFFPFMGNESLGPEESRSLEAGYDRRLARGTMSVTLFRGDYDGLIVFDLAALRFENVGAANARGMELSIEQRLTDAVFATATYTLTETEEEGMDRPLPRRPRHSGALFLNYRKGSVHGGLAMLYTGSRADVLSVAPFSRITNEAFTTFDANLQFDAGRFTPYVKIENLTDVEYEEVSGYPSPSRRVIVGLRFVR